MDSPKILIVEDELITANDIKENLEKEGYEVIGIARSGEKALHLARHNPPDLVIMDIQLAGELDGIETAREMNCIKQIPFIFLTANNEKKIIDKAKKSFPAAFLSKPVRVADFTANIEIALNNFKKTGEDVKTNGFPKDNIYIPLKNGHQRLPKKDIYYIEASGSYVTIHTKSNNVVVSTNLGNIQKQLQCLQFVRISRKHIINLNHIDRIENNCIIINDKPLVIGETYKNDLLQQIQIIKTK